MGDAAYEAYTTSQEAVTAQMMELRVARSELSEIERVHVSHEELALTIDNMNQWNDKIDACLSNEMKSGWSPSANFLDYDLNHAHSIIADLVSFDGDEHSDWRMKNKMVSCIYFPI